MTDTEKTDLNIKLAEILGAKWAPSRYNWYSGQITWYALESPKRDGDWARKSKSGKTIEYFGPDFCSSVDAQAPLVKLVEERGLQSAYVNKIAKIIWKETGDAPSEYDLLHISALIRAQAFLEVLS